MRKKNRLTAIAVITLIILSIVGIATYDRQSDAVANLYGQWKVTEFLTMNSYVTDWDLYYDVFLGRSIKIDEEQIVRSIEYWPDKLDVHYRKYDDVQVENMDANMYNGQRRLMSPWDEKYEGQEVTAVNFYENGNIFDDFVITQQGEVICGYLSCYFYMEPYVKAVTNLRPSQLDGTWEVKRLVSYQEGWQGTSEMYHEFEWAIDRGPYTEEEGADFYPTEYYGQKLTINLDKNILYLYDAAIMPDAHGISGYDSRICDRRQYEEEKGIHDELGILNDEIQVITFSLEEFYNVEALRPDGDHILDGEIIVIDKDRIIIKIYQGWFLLKRFEY